MQKRNDKIWCLWSFTKGRQSFPWTMNRRALKWYKQWDSGGVRILLRPPMSHVRHCAGSSKSRGKGDYQVITYWRCSSSNCWWQKTIFSHSHVSGLLYSSASQLDLDQMEKNMPPSHCLSLSFSCVWERESPTMCIEDRQSHKHEAGMCCHAAHIDCFVSDWSPVSMHSSHIISLLMSLTSSTYSFYLF